MLLNGTENYAIEGFRESGKTQYVLRSFIQYALTFPHPSRDYIVLIKANTTLAENKLKETIEEWLANPAACNNLRKINQQSGGVFCAEMLDSYGKIQTIRIESYGKGAAIRGLSYLDRRPKICIIDDPQDISDAQSYTVQEHDWNWFLEDVMFLGKSTRLFLIGNNLGERCIVERVFENAEELKFETLRVPAIVNGQSLWPERFPAEFLEKEKESYRNMGKLDVWLRERLCVAASDENRIFRKEDFRYYSFGALKRMAPDMNFFMTIDPAASLKESADYRALVVNAVDQDDNWFIVEISYGLYDPFQVIDEIFRLVSTWKLREIGIEEGALKASLEPFLMREMQKRRVYFNILALEAKTKKEERIKMLQPRFRAHTIYFPDESSWLSELEAELLSFTMQGTRGLHDDLIDALAYQEQIVKQPYKPQAFGPGGKLGYMNLPKSKPMLTKI